MKLLTFNGFVLHRLEGLLWIVPLSFQVSTDSFVSERLPLLALRFFRPTLGWRTFRFTLAFTFMARARRSNFIGLRCSIPPSRDSEWMVVLKGAFPEQITRLNPWNVVEPLAWLVDFFLSWLNCAMNRLSYALWGFNLSPSSQMFRDLPHTEWLDNFPLLLTPVYSWTATAVSISFDDPSFHIQI